MSAIQQRSLELAARDLGFRLQILTMRRWEDLDGTLSALNRRHVDAFVIVPDAVLLGSDARIAQQSLKSKVPGIFALRAIVDAGG